MSTKRLGRLIAAHRPTSAAIAAVVCASALLVTQSMESASAATDANRVDHVENCQSALQQACLWINAPDDPNPAKAADMRALIITPGIQTPGASGADLDDPTGYGKGKVHGMTAEFTDDISVGWNFLPYDLCLMDTSESLTGTAPNGDPLRTSTFIFVAKSGKSFAQLADWNDKVDYYTTAQKGKCPRGGVTFDANTQEITDSW